MIQSLFCADDTADLSVRYALILLVLDRSNDFGQIHDTKVQHDKGRCHEHVPIGVWDEVIHHLQNGVGGIDRIHVVELDDIARPVYDVVCHGVAVEINIDQMHAGVNACSQGKCCGDVDQLLLGQSQREHQDRNANFQGVREVVEEKGPGQDLIFSLSLVKHKCNQRTYAPEQ